MLRRNFFAWLLQVLPQPPRNLMQIPQQQFTCPLGHTTAAWQSSFSANTLICVQCGVYFHILPLK